MFLEQGEIIFRPFLKINNVYHCFSGTEDVEKDAEQRDREVQLSLPDENNPEHQPPRVGPQPGVFPSSQTSRLCSAVSSCKVRKLDP